MQYVNIKMSVDAYETMGLWIKYTHLPFPFPWFPKRSKISIDKLFIFKLAIQFPEIHTLEVVLLLGYFVVFIVHFLTRKLLEHKAIKFSLFVLIV